MSNEAISDGAVTNHDLMSSALDAWVLNQMIAESAYYRAVARGFKNGDPVQDWLEAEADIMNMCLLKSCQLK